MPYYSGQGRVLIAERNSTTGQPGAFRFVGNVPSLQTDFAVELADHFESYSGNRLGDNQLTKTKKATFKCSIEDWNIKNIQLALLGASVAQTAGTVVDEALPTGLVVGDIARVSGANISVVSIKDSTPTTPKTLPPAGYTVNASGSIELKDITTGGAYVQPFKVSYTKGAATQIAMFKGAIKEYFVRFEGLNTNDGNAPITVEFYRVPINPTKTLDLITQDLAKFDLEGSCLIDPTKPATGDMGQYGQIIMHV